MAEEHTIGKAYVQILPSTEGIKGRLQNALSGPAEEAGQSAGSSMGEGIKTGLGKMASVIGTSVAAASAAVVALGKSAIESYADYEQLVGGVETLFGAGGQSLEEYAAGVGKSVEEAKTEYDSLMGAQNTVMENARQAFMTAGLSANEYMETVTSFSASLIQSLGGDTEKAAVAADKAIIDMADNANKMGTSMESIQNAYQGFAKQNYTMLDNLKLGYGGTKSEMERLVQDAEKLDTSFKASRDANGHLALSFGDIVDAIHIVQTDMGITGTTSKEASQTISGSVNAMKAAWKNLVTGIADDNADFDRLVQDLVNTLVGDGTGSGGVINNILPRIKTALQGIGKLVEGLAPIIAEALPKLIAEVLPSLLETAMSLVQTAGGAILDNLPLLMDCGLQLLLTFADGIIESLPEIIPAVVDIVLRIVEKLTDPESFGKVIDAALQIILALAQGLINAIPELIVKAPVIILNLVDALIDNLPKVFDAGWELLKAVANGLLAALPEIAQALLEFWATMSEKIPEWKESLREWGGAFIGKIIDGIKEFWENLKQAVRDTAQIVKNFLGFGDGSEPTEGPLTKAADFGINLIRTIADGISGAIDFISTSVDTITSAISNAFSDLWESALTWGSDLISNFIDGIKQGWSNLKGTLGEFAEKISDWLGFSEPKEGPLSNFHTYAPDMMALFAKGIRDNEDLVTAQIERSFDFSGLLGAPQLAGAGTGGGAVTNYYTITVNGISELDEIIRWFQGRQVEGRMA